MSFSGLVFTFGLALLSLQTTTSSTAQLGDVPFEVQADHLFADTGAEIYLAEGSVYLRRGEIGLRADRLWYSAKTERAVAEGHVVLVRGNEVLRCQRVEIDLPSRSFQIEDFELRLMRGASPRSLRAALAEGRAPDAGRTLLTLEGESAQRPSEHEFTVRGARVTPCGCGEGETPSFSIHASSASIDLDEGAWLTLPVLYVKSVPVFVLPVMYVPFGERRTGFLTPRMGYDPVTGFRVTEPFFLTLGRSYDLTLFGTYYTSRGFSAATEGRWAPSKDSAGEAKVTVLFDDGAFDPTDGAFHRDRDEVLGRFAITGKHDTKFGEGRLAMDLDLVGDPQWKTELLPTFLERQVEESVSRLTYAESYDGPLRVAVGAALRQDLRQSRYAALTEERREVSLFSAELPGPGAVRYRLLELRLDAAPAHLARALPGLLGEARLAVSGFAAPNPQVPRFARADFRPELTWPIDLFGLFVLAPSVALRTTAWSGQANDESLALGQIALVAKTELFTELSRRFGEISHRVRPSFRHLVLPVLARTESQAFFVADEIDLLADVHQVAASIDNDVFYGGRRVFGLSALFGSDLGFRDQPGQGASPLYLNLELELHDVLPDSSLRLGARAGLDLELGRLEQLVASMSLVTSSWLSVSMHFGEMGSRVPRSSFVAPEELVPSNTISRAGYLSPTELAVSLADPASVLLFTPYRGLTGGITVRPWAALAIGTTASFDFVFEEENAALSADQQRQNSALRNVSGYLRYDSPCDCWGALFQMGWARDRSGPDVRVAVDLAQLGG